MRLAWDLIVPRHAVIAAGIVALLASERVVSPVASVSSQSMLSVARTPVNQ